MTPEKQQGEGVPEVVPQEWFIYRGTGRPIQDMSLLDVLPAPPPWRRFNGSPVLPAPEEDLEELNRRLGPVDFLPPRKVESQEAIAVNAALILRRPLLVTGRPGVGKSTLAYQISRELRLGHVLRWPINSRTTLRSGLYEYDAIGRVQEARLSGGESRSSEANIGDYMQLGPLGTALLPYESPRVLLIDEFDKSDADLANDLLDVLEEGTYQIPELFRIRTRTPEVTVHTSDHDRAVVITMGVIRCREFPFIVITSNGEREFPPAFLRRCVRLEMQDPGPERLADLVTARFSDAAQPYKDKLIEEFLSYRRRQPVAADQLLNALYLAMQGPAARVDSRDESWRQVLDVVLQRLDTRGLM